MKVYRCFQHALAAFVVAYPVVSGVILVWTGRECFPLFSWSLYTFVPNRVEEFSVKLREVDGQAVEPPLLFNKAGRWFKKANSVNAFHTIQQMGKALLQGDERRLAEKRAFFEATFLDAAVSVRYDLIQHVYDPLERWKDPSRETARVIKSFHYDRGLP